MTTADHFQGLIMTTIPVVQMISGEIMKDHHLPLAIRPNEAIVNLRLKETRLARAWRCQEVATNKGRRHFSPEMSPSSSPNLEEEDKNQFSGGINMTSYISIDLFVPKFV